MDPSRADGEEDGGGGMTIFGAWVRRPSFADIDFAASIGLRRLDVMVNEMAKARGPTKFVVDWDAIDYQNVVGKASQEGIEVHFTSWVMPHAEFVKRAADELQHLCQETGAHGVVFDAEEPWTQAEKPDYWNACELLHAGMMGCRYGVTGIGWASKWLQNLVARANYGCPQLYSTSTSSLDPHEYGGPLAHWSKWNACIVPALAAYRTTPAVLRAAIAEVSPEDTILLWALRHLKAKSGASLRKVIIDATKEQEAA